MATKICSKCKKELDISCFNKDKGTKKGVACQCKLCRKQYRKDNGWKRIEYDKQYREDNIKRRAKYQKKYYKSRSKEFVEKARQYRKDKPEQVAESKKKYYDNNTEQIAKRDKLFLKTKAPFKTYFEQLEQFEEIRQCSGNLELLEAKCAYCGKWMFPTRLQVKNRIIAINTISSGEQRFYCSENCRLSCPIFNQVLWPRGFKKATSREVVPLLRQLVLERDDYTCQKCGATTETAQLHVHHEKSYTLNKIMANDPDNCITLCKECHKEIHLQEGCKYTDLKC